MTYREIHIPERIDAPITEPAPVIQWLKLSDLVVDERYQRPLHAPNWVAIRKIASGFLWSRFGAVLVAPIEGGRYAIIDGQHRVHAAAMRGVEQVPAMIVLIRAEEQAKAFVDVNTKTVRINITTLYKAALAAGDDWAVQSHAAVTAAGCRLATRAIPLRDRKPGDLMGIGLVRAAVEQGHALAVTSTLGALMEFEPTNVANLADEILRPLLAAVIQCPDADLETLIRAFRAKRPALVIDAAARLVKSEGGGNRVLVATGMFRALIRAQMPIGAEHG